MKQLSWIEISKDALLNNIKTFRGLVEGESVLAPAVKANAYGHGMIGCAELFLEAGANYLCVNALFEAKKLRESGIKSPILIIGYVPLEDLYEVANLGVEMIVYNPETIEALSKIKKNIGIHLKIETGNNRQGISLENLPKFAEQIKVASNIDLVGVSTHFANIEDANNMHYAQFQLEGFLKAINLLEEAGLAPKYRHCANTAATILLPEARFNFVRTGIGNYGLWPSRITEKSSKSAGINIELKPALTWKTLVAQVKEVKTGSLVGYGCTYAMERDGKIAILPVGYYDGYNRLLSNKSAVMIHGKRAPVIGRVCMNIIMVDVTDIPDVKLEDEVVLLGRQGKAKITAEEHAEWTDTINYEVTTRINERIPRYFV